MDVQNFQPDLSDSGSFCNDLEQMDRKGESRNG